METTIDAAGRVVIPKGLREQIGLVPGPVTVVVDGASVRLAPLAQDATVLRKGRLLVPATGTTVTDEVVQGLRATDRR